MRHVTETLEACGMRDQPVAHHGLLVAADPAPVVPRGEGERQELTVLLGGATAEVDQLPRTVEGVDCDLSVPSGLTVDRLLSHRDPPDPRARGPRWAPGPGGAPRALDRGPIPQCVNSLVLRGGRNTHRSRR